MELDFSNRPYVVNQQTYKVMVHESNGDNRYVVMHEFKRLDAGNSDLLVKKEKATIRVRQNVGRGRAKARFDETKADAALYKELIVAGGWRPADLEPVKNEDLISEENRSLYTFNEDTGEWVPGWNEISRSKCLEITPEKMKFAIDTYLECRAEVLSVGSGIDFMFEQGGTMRVSLKIGDPDSPSYTLLLEIRRPESGRRNSFKDSFVSSIEDTRGEMAKIETTINLRSGIAFFQEHLATVLEEDEFNPVVFRDDRTVAATVADGDTPTAHSAVEDLPALTPYTDQKRGDFLKLMNPMFQVEVAAAVVAHFNKTDRE